MVDRIFDRAQPGEGAEAVCDRYAAEVALEVSQFVAEKISDDEADRKKAEEAVLNLAILGEPVESAWERWVKSQPFVQVRVENEEVLVDANETRISMEALVALKRRGGVFQRASVLVEPRLDPARKLPGLLRPAEEFRMVEIRHGRARSLAAEVCWFFKESKGDPVQVNVPDWLPGAIVSRPDWPGIPVVESLAENPTLRADGTVHEDPGYDPDTGNYFSADGQVFPLIPENPTRDDARAAFEAILEPLCDFPFVAAHDRSVAAAIVLTLLARGAIPGPTPPFVLHTPTPRTGKDLLTDALTILGTGRPAPGRSLPGDDVELQKLLLSLGIASVRVVSFGNCEGPIGSPALSHAVTREVVGGRLLGANRDVTVPLRPVWIFNGNNPYFQGDFGPRVVLLQMDAKMEDPQARTNFRYDPLLTHVRSERPRLVVAGLTILRAYAVAGRPRHGRAKKGSFEGWDDLVRGALLWLGAEDPLLGDRDVRTMADADLDKLRALLGAWRTAFGDRPVTLAEVVDASRPAFGKNGISDGSRRDLQNALAALDGRFGDRYTASSVSYAIRHHKNRRVDVDGAGDPRDVLRLVLVAERSKTAKVGAWRVLDATARDDAPVADNGVRESIY